MTRDQIVAKWNGMTPRERNAWVAEVVMGWRRVSRPGGGGGYIGWENADGRIVAIESDCTMSTGPQDWFRPSQDVRSAWTVFEHMNKTHWISIMRIAETSNVTGNYVAECGGNSAGSNSASEAICLAAIIAKLTDTV